MLDTPAQLVRYAPKIMERAVVSADMPLGNETGMVPAERAERGAWINEGARIL